MVRRILRLGGKTLVAMVVAGSTVSGVTLLNNRVAEESRNLAGYAQQPLTSPRVWWVEAYDYVQGLAWAHRIVHAVAPASLPPDVRVKRLAIWAFDHFLSKGIPLPLQEDHFFNTARRGYGTCDQLAHVLATLYWSAGYPARLLMLRDAQGVSPHTVAQVLVNHRWVLVDPSFKVIFQDRQGRLLTVEDLSQFPNVLEAYRAKTGFHQVTLADFQRGTVFTTPPYTSCGNLVAKIVGGFQRSLRPSGAPHVRTDSASAQAGREDVASSRLVRGIHRLDQARRYELLNEDERAHILYADLLRDPTVPDQVKAIARYWLARLAWRLGDQETCLAHLTLPLSSASEEPWRTASQRLWGYCTVTPHSSMASQVYELEQDGSKPSS